MAADYPLLAPSYGAQAIREVGSSALNGGHHALIDWDARYISPQPDGLGEFYGRDRMGVPFLMTSMPTAGCHYLEGGTNHIDYDIGAEMAALGGQFTVTTVQHQPVSNGTFMLYFTWTTSPVLANGVAMGTNGTLVDASFCSASIGGVFTPVGPAVTADNATPGKILITTMTVDQGPVNTTVNYYMNGTHQGVGITPGALDGAGPASHVSFGILHAGALLVAPFIGQFQRAIIHPLSLPAMTVARLHKELELDMSWVSVAPIRV